MTETEYNGWTNRETWLVDLWIDNEYDLYMAKVDRLKGRDLEDVTLAFVKRTAKELLPRGFYNDGGRIGKVNWAEIAESWRTELAELIEYDA